MKYYLSKNYKGFSAGNKAKTDIEQIMEKLHFRNAGLSQTNYTNSIAGFLITLAGVLKVPFCLHKGDVLVLQYPFKKYYTFLCKIAHLRGCKVVTLIHDLGSFRRKRLTVSKEIAGLNHSDYIIAHNQSMKQWLQDNGCTAQPGTLEIFDYLSAKDAPSRKTDQENYKVIYAGNLHPRKNTFLYQLQDYAHSYRIILYGSGFEEERIHRKESFDCKGFIPSDELIEKAEGDFGLVWDGDSVNTCSGDFGQYLQYNTPHKTSLYIRCELPVIIWDKAAMAGFVRDNRIGICIGSLEQLDTVLAELTPEKYDEMKANVIKISRLLSQGHYFTEAIDEALSCVSK